MPATTAARSGDAAGARRVNPFEPGFAVVLCAGVIGLRSGLSWPSVRRRRLFFPTSVGTLDLLLKPLRPAVGHCVYESTGACVVATLALAAFELAGAVVFLVLVHDSLWQVEFSRPCRRCQLGRENTATESPAGILSIEALRPEHLSDPLSLQGFPHPATVPPPLVCGSVAESVCRQFSLW